MTAQVYFKDGDTCYPTKLTHTRDYISSHQQMKTQATLQLGDIEKKETFTYNRENFLKAVRSFQSFPIYGSVLWEHLESERSYATNPSISQAGSIELINCVDDFLIAALTTTPKGKLHLEITDKNNPKNHIKVEIDSQLIPNPQGVVIAEYREKPATLTRRINEKTVQIYIASQGICFAMKLKMEFDEINQQEFETSKIFLGRLPIPPHAAKLKNTVLVFEKDLQDNNAILFKTDNNDLLLVINPSEENGLLKSQVYRRDLYGNWIKYRVDYGNDVIDFTSFEINMMISQKILKLKNSKESIGLTKIEADLESIGVKTTQAVRSLDIDYSRATLYSVGSMKPMYLLYVGETIYQRDEKGIWRELIVEEHHVSIHRESSNITIFNDGSKLSQNFLTVHGNAYYCKKIIDLDEMTKIINPDQIVA